MNAVSETVIATRYRPPALSSADAAILRCFATRRQPIPVMAGDGAPSTTLPHTAPQVLDAGLRRHDAGIDDDLSTGTLLVTGAPRVVQDPVCIGVRSGDETARAILPRSAVETLLQSLDPAAPQADPDILVLLLELALEPWLTRLAAALRSLPGQTITLVPDPGELRQAIPLGLRWHDGVAAEAVARLELGPIAAASLADALATMPRRRRRIDGLTVPLHVRALAAELTIAELRGIEVGDVILADAPAGGDTLLVAGERLVWRARLDQQRLQIVTACQRAGSSGLQEWMMQDTQQDTAPGAALDELPLRLTFELGRLEIPLAELEAIGPGHVFELGRDPQQAVDIMSAGRRIGRGEIVTVGPSLGIRVLWIGRE